MKAICLWSCFLCLSVFAGAALAYPTYTGPALRCRIANSCPSGHHTTLALKRFAELAAERSGNKITIALFPNNILGNDAAMLREVLRGNLEMASCTSSNLTSTIPSLMVFDLPYITDGNHQETLYASLDTGPLGAFFQKKFDEAGLRPIMYNEYGYRDFFSTRKPIRSPKDLVGLRIRTTCSPVEAEVAKALGMRPLPLAWWETLDALKRDVVDAEGNVLSILRDAGHADALRYGYLSRHNYAMHILSANSVWWNGLDPQAKRLLREAAKDALRHQRTILVPQSEPQARERLEALGVRIVEPTPEQLAELKRKTRPVWELFGDSVPQELIELVLETQK